MSWPDGTSGKFPAVYLRDNCQCPKCFLPSSQSRTFLTKDLDLDLKVQSIKNVEGRVS